MGTGSRKVVLENFYGDGKHLYEDELGCWPEAKEEVHSLVSRDIFEYEIVRVGFNLAFYYIDNDTCYGLHTEALSPKRNCTIYRATFFKYCMIDNAEIHKSCINYRATFVYLRQNICLWTLYTLHFVIILNWLQCLSSAIFMTESTGNAAS